jgi:c(7)-type cytochrome triheme protein
MHAPVKQLKRSIRCGLRVIGALAFLAVLASGQTYAPPPPPEPFDYGKVVLDSYASSTELGPVVFDHWLHRAMFTCRLCHVDLGFAMQARSTGIAASSNRKGLHCGACHDGKRIFQGRPIFASCSDDAKGKQCNRCHSVGKRGARKYRYWAFTAKLPKGAYGVDWAAAEREGKITPVDFLEGVPVKKTPMKIPPGFSMEADLSWDRAVLFPHEKHAVWNGCELCHPKIFPSTPKHTAQNSMFLHIEGSYCGACHGRVAFPFDACTRCHMKHDDVTASD